MYFYVTIVHNSLSLIKSVILGMYFMADFFFMKYYDSSSIKWRMIIRFSDGKWQQQNAITTVFFIKGKVL